MRLILQFSAAASLSLCISLGTLSRTVLVLRPPLACVGRQQGSRAWSLSTRDTTTTTSAWSTVNRDSSDPSPTLTLGKLAAVEKLSIP
jgi:hypothetical protein